MANFSVQDLCNEISNDRDMKQLCMDLSAKWTEFNLPSNIIANLKQELLKELVATNQTKVKTAKDKTEQQLKEHRVLKVRSDLEDWWTKCRFSDEQKGAFKPYHSKIFTDQLLLLHQEELRMLEHYYAENLPLFKAIDQYMELHNRYLELEVQAKNPNRLFDNRGGQLLKDERDRKAARKDLPKLEKKISFLTAEFERKYTRAFTLNGVSFEEYLKLHSEKLQEMREASCQLPSSSSDVVVRIGSGLKRKTSDTPTVCSSDVKPAKQPKQGLPVHPKSRKALHTVLPNNK